MKKYIQSGFTIVELLISLFIVTTFLLSGYQLFNVAIKNSSESRAQSVASNSAYEYLQRYKPSAVKPCVSLTPLTNGSIAVAGLANVTISVTITCPYAAVTSISKITSTIQYGAPSQTISIATYVKP